MRSDHTSSKSRSELVQNLFGSIDFHPRVAEVDPNNPRPTLPFTVLFIGRPVEELCAEDQDTSMDRVGSLLVESFEEVFGVRAEAGHLQQRFEEEAQKQPTIEYIFSTPESRFGQVK